MHKISNQTTSRLKSKMDFGNMPVSARSRQRARNRQRQRARQHKPRPRQQQQIHKRSIKLQQLIRLHKTRRRLPTRAALPPLSQASPARGFRISSISSHAGLLSFLALFSSRERYTSPDRLLEITLAN